METPFLTFQNASKWEDTARAYANSALDKTAPEGALDFVKDWAIPVPARTVMKLAGVPDADWEAFALTAYGSQVARDHPDYPIDKIRHVQQLMLELVQKRRAEPADDVISALVRGCVMGRPMADDMAVGVLSALIFGGFHTATTTICNMLVLLDEQPDLRTLVTGMRFAKDFSNDRFRNPRISNNLFASGCYAATSPIALEANRQESYWIYRSNFPGVYAGDNDYFMHDHDLRRDGDRFDPERAKVYLLSGSYDPSLAHEDCRPQEVARRFPGVDLRILEGLSHFAPSDDPEGFSHAIRPILKEVAASA